MGSLGRHPLLVAMACAGALALSACNGSSSGGGGGGSGPSSAGVSPASGGGSSGYVPASGTADTGELFPVYTNSTVGYSVRYPGGWRIHQDSPNTVRIARFGDAITIIVRPRVVCLLRSLSSVFAAASSSYPRRPSSAQLCRPSSQQHHRPRPHRPRPRSHGEQANGERRPHARERERELNTYIFRAKERRG